MREVHIAEVSEKILKQLPEGAFLTVKHGGKVNTMTIGWGTLGCVWSRSVFTVLVRCSRYTYDIMNQADSFTVSLPLDGQLVRALDTCGTKSGRDMDKFKECNLTPEYTEAVKSPYIAECDINVNCKIIYKQPLDPRQIPEEIRAKYYKDGDFHAVYYGEVVKTFVK